MASSKATESKSKMDKESDSEATEKDTLSGFRSRYLKDYRDVKIFLKSKKYARYGLYLSGLLWYFVLAFYFSSDIAITSSTFIGSAILAPISTAITILLYLNKRRYGFTQEDITYHEVAALIDTYLEEDDDLQDQIDRFSDIVLDNDNPILAKAWKEELEYYFSYVDGKDEDAFFDSFETVGLLLINSLNRLRDVDLEDIVELEEEVQTNQSEDPGFIDVLLDSLSSEYLTKESFLWVTFILAAIAGLGLAFLKGQGWGVLLVTIVFGGLRLYDRQTD